MRQITIENFSCIKEAALEFNRMTVLIGPQASGKSVICKLGYFFIDILSHQATLIIDGATFEAYKEYVASKFLEWFPFSAWGDGKFVISFSAGDYKISIARTSYSKKVSAKFRIKFSDEFIEQYAETRILAAKVLEKAASKNVGAYDYEREWRVRDLTERFAEKMLGKDFIAGQMFIPAGRSFFTSIGKAVAAFEQGRVLDPLIIQFGRLFTAYKDRSNYFVPPGAKERRAALDDAFEKILGGRLIFAGDQEFVECTDGRRVPLSALSSGQQELLPLVTVVPRMATRRVRQAIYIEEPEAHLFPSAQSNLVEIFASMISQSATGLDMILTTHSPYVLVKINNLIKAGQLGRSQSGLRRERVQAVIPRSAWLGSRFVNAYAIKDGVVEKIMDEDGMINADYLDNVSGEIASEFLRLLEIETAE